jgi:hypothetical protein
MTMLKTLNVLALSLALSGLAHAEFAVVGDGQFVPVAYEPSDAAVQQSTALSCKEARATAWFNRELSRTDGEADPQVAFSPCGQELLAKSSADAD